MRIGSSTIFRGGNTPVPVFDAIPDENAQGFHILKMLAQAGHDAPEILAAREVVQEKPYPGMG